METRTEVCMVLSVRSGQYTGPARPGLAWLFTSVTVDGWFRLSDFELAVLVG